ncbi:MAG: hypothetical protein QXJ32_05215 [Thermoplasmata archaeon]
MRVIQVKCPSCNGPIYMKQKDSLFYCEKCNVMHTRETGTPERVDFEIADFGPNAAGERVYMPFWRVYAYLLVRSKSVEGGTLFKLMQLLKGGSDSGNVFIYVPASEMDIGSFKRLATQMTLSNPRYATKLNFGGVPRLPTTMTRKDAIELADFVVVTMEAEQPGVLQRLDYTLTVNDTKMVYLPFVRSAQGLVPAF